MKVAVVIPCRNEERYIARCVESVLHSEYPAELLEVLVCDGMSDDKTRGIVENLSRENPRVRLVDNPHRTTPFALNLGIQHATSPDVVIILGAHAEIAPDYVRLCVEDLRNDPSAGCVGGLLESVNEDSTTSVIALAMSSPFGVGNAHFRTGKKSGYVDTVAFGAYRKAVFEKIGLFDEVLVRNQDDEFNYRVTKAGFRIILDPRIRAKYYVRSAFRKLFRQYYQYGLWKVYVNRKHGAVTTMRQLVPPAFMLFLFSAVAIPLLPLYGIAWGIIFVLYFCLACLAAFRQGASAEQIPGVIAAFILLHAGYGTGYLHGTWKFLVLRKQPGRDEILSR